MGVGSGGGAEIAGFVEFALEGSVEVGVVVEGVGFVEGAGGGVDGGSGVGGGEARCSSTG